MRSSGFFCAVQRSLAIVHTRRHSDRVVKNYPALTWNEIWKLEPPTPVLFP